jgi:hypothetical protein
MSGLALADTSVPRRRGPNYEADAIMAMMTKSIDVSRLQLRRLRKDVERYHHLTGADSGSSSPGATTEGEFLASSAETRTALYADLHLLFIKLHEADQLLSRLKHLMSQEPELACLRNKHRMLFRRCDEYRRHLEKVDEDHLSDTGNLNENIYSFHGKKFDIGPDLEKNVEDLLKDVVSSWARIRDHQRSIRYLITKSQPPTEQSS